MIFFTKKDTPINSFQEARLSDRKDDNKINRTVKNVEKFIRIIARMEQMKKDYQKQAKWRQITKMKTDSRRFSSFSSDYCNKTPKLIGINMFNWYNPSGNQCKR